MAVTFQIRNSANTVIAQRTIPDAALPILSATWAPGPGTAAENALRFMLQVLYQETRQRHRNAGTADELAALKSAEASEEAAFEAAFPTVV